jgi:iron complex transport system ATP-binding protein
VSTAIQTDNLVFAYDSRLVLDRAQLRFERGEMVALLGPNGSGKTTLLKVLSGVLRGSGDVRVGGRELRTYGRRELSKFIGVVPQESQLVFPYTVAEIVLMGRASRHGPFAFESARDLQVARKSMEATEIASLADRYMHELSGGEKQRVMIARALAQEPEILLLDEPAAFLDLKHQVHILDLMRRLHRDHGLTIIAALHDLNLAALFFPRLVMLHNGKVYRDGPPEEVLNEETIDQVYGIRVRVRRYTSGERPQVFISPLI